MLYTVSARGKDPFDPVMMFLGRNFGDVPLTNHHVEHEEYETIRPLLERYHRERNAAIVTNDDRDALRAFGFSRFKVRRARNPGHGLSTGY